MALDALYNAARAVLRFSSFEESARTIFDEACRITGARSGYVALLSEDGQENEVLFLEAGGMPCTVDPLLPMPIRGLRAEAYRERKVVWDNDFMASEHVAFMPEGHVELRNVLFAPLVIEDRAEGVIGLANKEGDFTAEDVRLVGALGEIASVALYNSRNLDQLKETVARLEQTLAEVKALRGIIPICARCKKVRDDSGYWEQVEEFVQKHSEVEFTHGLCPDCLAQYYRDLPRT